MVPPKDVLLEQKNTASILLFYLRDEFLSSEVY